MTELIAADSWLVVDGHARARSSATGRASPPPARSTSQAFRAEVERAVPAEGRWFPRVELRADGELAFHVRPAPPREPTVVAWIADVPDPRRAPRRKGPDLERLAALRDRAATHGAGEAVIADADGRLLEGAYTSLLWWEGETLCAVPDEAPILPGITRALLIELAGTRGAAPPRAGRPRRPRDLAGQRPPRHPRRDALGGRSRARRGPARGHMAAPARKSQCHQRWLIPDERHRSGMRTATSRKSAAYAHSQAYDHARVRRVGEPPQTPVR